jgi:hypothetical protein
MESVGKVAALMRSSLPPEVSLREFGQDIMRWGTGSAMAQQRIETLTADELRVAGLTAEMAENWAMAYEIVMRLMPQDPSAAGRAKLMRYAANLLREPSI